MKILVTPLIVRLFPPDTCPDFEPPLSGIGARICALGFAQRGMIHHDAHDLNDLCSEFGQVLLAMNMPGKLLFGYFFYPILYEAIYLDKP